MEETVLVSAVLHDTLEDTETTLEELNNRFGRAIASTVSEVSDSRKARRQDLQPTGRCK